MSTANNDANTVTGVVVRRDVSRTYYSSGATPDFITLAIYLSTGEGNGSEKDTLIFGFRAEDNDRRMLIRERDPVTLHVRKNDDGTIDVVTLKCDPSQFSKAFRAGIATK